MGSPEERAAKASELRAEAYALLQDTRLFELLARSFTEPMVTGSASYDLMVWRDIDIHMSISADRYRDWMSFGSTLVKFFDAIGMPLQQANYVNDVLDPQPNGAGLHWGLRFRDLKGDAWELGLWGFEPFDYAVRQARDFTLKTDLAACDRDLVLRLKAEARQREHYHGVRVSSWDIYQFVIAKAGTSLSALEQWKKQR